jgi:hypothetical protein
MLPLFGDLRHQRAGFAAPKHKYLHANTSLKRTLLLSFKRTIFQATSL